MLQPERGKEIADHKNFTVASKVEVYICDPRNRWQRGTAVLPDR
jgi:IS30 family transposase